MWMYPHVSHQTAAVAFAGLSLPPRRFLSRTRGYVDQITRTAPVECGYPKGSILYPVFVYSYGAISVMTRKRCRGALRSPGSAWSSMLPADAVTKTSLNQSDLLGQPIT